MTILFILSRYWPWWNFWLMRLVQVTRMWSLGFHKMRICPSIQLQCLCWRDILHKYLYRRCWCTCPRWSVMSRFVFTISWLLWVNWFFAVNINSSISLICKLVETLRPFWGWGASLECTGLVLVFTILTESASSLLTSIPLIPWIWMTAWAYWPIWEYYSVVIFYFLLQRDCAR